MAKTFVHAHHKVNKIDRKLERSARHARRMSAERVDSRAIRYSNPSSRTGLPRDYFA